MDRRDYYVEYYEVLDRVLSDYVNHLREEKEYWLKIGGHDVGVPLINLLFWQFTWHREEYDRLRKEGKSCGEALGSVKEILADKQVEEWERQEEEYKIYDHEWYEALAPYGGQLVIYIYNARQLAYLTPLIERLEEPVLLLSELFTSPPVIISFIGDTYLTGFCRILSISSVIIGLSFRL